MQVCEYGESIFPAKTFFFLLLPPKVRFSARYGLIETRVQNFRVYLL